MHFTPKIKFSFFIFFIIFIVGLLYFWLKPDHDKANLSTQNNKSDQLNNVENIALQQNGDLESFFKSKTQQDIQIQCHITANATNQLIVDIKTRDCYEFFLSQISEKELIKIKSQFVTFAKLVYTDPLQSQLIDLWNRYLQYREQLGALKPPKTKSHNAEYYTTIFDLTKALRKQHFSDVEIKGLFGIDDEYQDFFLARMRIHEASNLSEVQKAEQISQAFRDLPLDLQNDIQQLTKVEDLTRLTVEIKSRGGSAEEIRQMRINLVGLGATQRLENLDAENLQWKTQVNRYLAERDTLITKNMNKIEKSEIEQKLRGQYFKTPEEQLRIQTFEKIHDQGQALPFPP